MSISSEFKEFIARGNVVDLAVGVVIGGAFGKIIDSLVKDFIMPVVGLLTGGVDFSAMKLVLQAADEAIKKPELAISYGNLINAVLQFIIIAFAVFLMVKSINRMRRPKEEVPAEPAPPPPSETYLKEIRDLLAKK